MTRVSVFLLGALAAGCSLVIESDDISFDRPGLRRCASGAALYVKSARVGQSGWFSAVLAAEENLIVAIAPTEAGRPPRPGVSDGEFVPNPQDQLPAELDGAGTVHFFERDA